MLVEYILRVSNTKKLLFGNTSYFYKNGGEVGEFRGSLFPVRCAPDLEVPPRYIYNSPPRIYNGHNAYDQ